MMRIWSVNSMAVPFDQGKAPHGVTGCLKRWHSNLTRVPGCEAYPLWVVVILPVRGKQEIDDGQEMPKPASGRQWSRMSPRLDNRRINDVRSCFLRCAGSRGNGDRGARAGTGGCGGREVSAGPGVQGSP